MSCNEILQASTESFTTARILVAPAVATWGDRPYTLQPGLCGTEGDYTHFTPSYFTNSSVLEAFGARGMDRDRN